MKCNIFLFTFCKKFILTKDKIKKTIDSLPENPTVEEVIEQLILLDKVEQGLKDADEGRVYTTDQVKERLGKWLR